MQTLGRQKYQLLHWFWAAMDLLYPPYCGGCKIRGDRFCADCFNKVEIIQPPTCDYCGYPQNYPGSCWKCKNDPPVYNALRSWAAFSGPLRQVLHRLKYQHDRGLGELLSHHLIEFLQQLEWKIDLVVPVPLGLVRQNERGYNQADLLARPLAMGCGYVYRKNAVRRIRETRSQVGLTAKQRMLNVDGAFKADPLLVTNQCILIVDDVTTSGATIKACASALLEAGAREVYGLTLARALQAYHDYSQFQVGFNSDAPITIQEDK
ncbi:MAG: double zinc ribbon domain-containing protein [Anaerolineales bacterium]